MTGAGRPPILDEKSRGFLPKADLGSAPRILRKFGTFVILSCRQPIQEQVPPMSHPNAVFALLSDQSGMILLVRRRGSLLWSLPGGELRSPCQVDEMLTTYCQRQIGVSPEFACRFIEFTLGGKRIAIGVDEIPKARAAARGRAEAVQWVNRTSLPSQIDPAVRLAVALFGQQQQQQQQAAPVQVI